MCMCIIRLSSDLLLSSSSPRHSEALSVVRRGLDMVTSYRPSVNMTWPGVDELMQDCLPQNIEVSKRWEEELRKKGGSEKG